uniref:Uncharacterized protein n=1 Tax=Palpitomonas bilix TaxID=652834 RepID=A0A7S3CY19_9EUKA
MTKILPETPRGHAMLGVGLADSTSKATPIPENAPIEQNGTNTPRSSRVDLLSRGRSTPALHTPLFRGRSQSTFKKPEAKAIPVLVGRRGSLGKLRKELKALGATSKDFHTLVTEFALQASLKRKSTELALCTILRYT